MSNNVAWKTKAAVDLHTKGSMLLKRNKTFAFCSLKFQRFILRANFKKVRNLHTMTVFAA